MSSKNDEDWTATAFGPVLNRLPGLEDIDEEVNYSVSCSLEDSLFPLGPFVSCTLIGEALLTLSASHISTFRDTSRL
jgi:hypothetical protein